MTANMLTLVALAVLISSLALLTHAWRAKPEGTERMQWADRETASLFGVICWAVGVSMCAMLFLLLLVIFGVR